MDSQLDAVVKLLNGSRTEEKVAGVILATQYLTDSDGPADAKKLTTIVKTATPAFIVRMIQTTSQVNGANVVQSAGLKILGLTIHHKNVLAMFRGELLAMITSLYLCSMNDEAKATVSSSIRELLGACTDDSLIAGMKRALSEYEAFKASVRPLEVLDVFASMLSHMNSATSLSLEVGEAALLRSLFVQVFHGAAPETVRDGALEICSTLLGRSQQLVPDWTTKSSLGEDQAAKSDTNFPVLLVSIIRGELHLVGEELVSLSTLTREKLDIDQRMLARVERCTKIHCTCMELLRSVLSLLVGKDTSDDAAGDEKAAANAHWSALPYKQLLEVRKALDNVIKEQLDFVRDIGGTIKTGPTEDNRIMSDGQLKGVVAVATRAVCGYVSEDTALLSAFVDYLPHMMKGSVVGAAATDDRLALVNHITTAGDVLQFTLPVVLGVLHSQAGEEEEEEAQRLLDRLYSALDCVMGPAVGLLDLLVAVIGELLAHEVSSGKEGSAPASSLPGVGNTRALLNSAMSLAVMCSDLLQTVFEMKDFDLRSLLQCEGGAAFQTIVFVPAGQIKGLYGTMKSGLTPVKPFTRVLERELQVLSLAPTSGSVSTSAALVERGVMDLLCSAEQYSTSLKVLAKQVHAYWRVTEVR